MLRNQVANLWASLYSYGCIGLSWNFRHNSPCPVEGILALLDVLLCGAALFLETHRQIRLHRLVGDHEAAAREQASVVV